MFHQPETVQCACQARPRPPELTVSSHAESTSPCLMFHAATHNTAKHMRHNNHITAERITHDMLSGIIKLDVAFTSNLQHKDNISNA